jgi:hypothetical protein
MLTSTVAVLEASLSEAVLAEIVGMAVAVLSEAAQSGELLL